MTEDGKSNMYTIQVSDGTRFGPASLDQLKEWAQGGRIDNSTLVFSDDGGPGTPAEHFPPLQGHISSSNDAMATIVPWRNKCALIGYYLGIFGLIPILGVPLAMGGIILGGLGIRHWKNNHRSHGLVHSIVAIVCGCIGLGISLLLILTISAAAAR